MCARWIKAVHRVTRPCNTGNPPAYGLAPTSRVPWDGSVNVGGRFLLRLNTPPNTIAHKYREGKVESTLERELNVPATVADQANETLEQRGACPRVENAACAGHLIPCAASSWGSTNLGSIADMRLRSVDTPNTQLPSGGSVEACSFRDCFYNVAGA